MARRRRKCLRSGCTGRISEQVVYLLTRKKTENMFPCEKCGLLHGFSNEGKVFYGRCMGKAMFLDGGEVVLRRAKIV